jgi:hypothetical protein
MFDYRYHALSLAAVLFALAVGVVIGVAIGDSNLVSSAQNGIVHNLRSEVSASQHSLEQVGSKLSEAEQLGTDLWPFAVHGLLSERSIGLVFLGGSSDTIDTYVRDGVGEAGGAVKGVVAIREPLDLGGLAAQAHRQAARGGRAVARTGPGRAAQLKRRRTGQAGRARGGA